MKKYLTIIISVLTLTSAAAVAGHKSVYFTVQHTDTSLWNVLSSDRAHWKTTDGKADKICQDFVNGMSAKFEGLNWTPSTVSAVPFSVEQKNHRVRGPSAKKTCLIGTMSTCVLIGTFASAVSCENKRLKIHPALNHMIGSDFHNYVAGEIPMTELMHLPNACALLTATVAIKSAIAGFCGAAIYGAIRWANYFTDRTQKYQIECRMDYDSTDKLLGSLREIFEGNGASRVDEVSKSDPDKTVAAVEITIQ